MRLARFTVDVALPDHYDADDGLNPLDDIIVTGITLDGHSVDAIDAVIDYRVQPAQFVVTEADDA